jgi:hypothetical protein
MSVNTRNSIVTNGLVLYLDAASRLSYVSGSSSWQNLTPNYTGSISLTPSLNTFDGVSISPISGSGTNQAVFPNSTSVFNRQEATISLWVKIPEGSTTSQNLIFYGGGASNNLIFFYRNPGGGITSYQWLIYYTTTTGNSFYLVDFPYPSNQWYNTVLTYTSTGTASTYINGVLRNTQTIANFVQWNITSANSPSINLSSAGKDPGSFGALQYYNRAFSSQEITQNYNATKARFGLL